MLTVHNLGASNSIFNQFIAEIRSIKDQGDSMRFRRNMERMGEIFAYEISKTLRYKKEEISTPFGVTSIPLIQRQPVIATILRAGLPLHQGFLNYFDKAENAFVSAYRKHHRDRSFEIQLDYISCPDITNKTLIITDPMIATGQSMCIVYEALLENGKPKHTHIVSSIISSQGLEYLQSHLPPLKCTLWVGAIDDGLTAQSYIVPGLGDAGDLAFGNKAQD